MCHTLKIMGAGIWEEMRVGWGGHGVTPSWSVEAKADVGAAFVHDGRRYRG